MAYARGIDPHQFVEMYGGFALEESTVREVNFQRGEMLRIRIKGPQKQPFESFLYPLDYATTLDEVALRFAQTAQSGMFIEIVNGKLKWTFRVEQHAGQPAVTRVRGTQAQEPRGRQ
jgi:hypothetical protein